MNINFTGRQTGIITPALKTFATKKFDKLERHFEKITSIHVIFDIEKLRHIVEATILVQKGEVHASAESEDMYAAIDILIDKLDKQLIKHKEKLHDHRE